VFRSPIETRNARSLASGENQSTIGRHLSSLKRPPPFPPILSLSSPSSSSRSSFSQRIRKPPPPLLLLLLQLMEAECFAQSCLLSFPHTKPRSLSLFLLFHGASCSSLTVQLLCPPSISINGSRYHLQPFELLTSSTGENQPRLGINQANGTILGMNFKFLGLVI